jgi:hypothetical protein
MRRRAALSLCELDFTVFPESDMQNSAWLALFQRLPASQHADLVLVTSVGMEIMVQRIVRAEEDFLVLRGRPAGSTEAARVVVLPYDQINHLAINRPLPEPQIQKLFDPSWAPAEGTAESATAANLANEAVENSAVDSVPPASDAAESTPPAEPPDPQAPEAGKNNKASPPSKSLLLARLRARLAEKKG